MRNPFPTAQSYILHVITSYNLRASALLTKMDPEEYVALADCEKAKVAEEPQPQSVPTPMPMKWRGSLLQCCGSSKRDCGACVVSTCLPCVAFGYGSYFGIPLRSANHPRGSQGLCPDS